jgi:hypothetical protein
MKNTADVTGGKPIAVLLPPISGVSDINLLVAFYDIHGGKREVLFFYFVPDTTRDKTHTHKTHINIRFKGPHNIFLEKNSAGSSFHNWSDAGRNSSEAVPCATSRFLICVDEHLRINYKYGSLPRNKFLVKSVTTLK